MNTVCEYKQSNTEIIETVISTTTNRQHEQLLNLEQKVKSSSQCQEIKEEIMLQLAALESSIEDLRNAALLSKVLQLVQDTNRFVQTNLGIYNEDEMETSLCDQEVCDIMVRGCEMLLYYDDDIINTEEVVIENSNERNDEFMVEDCLQKFADVEEYRNTSLNLNLGKGKCWSDTYIFESLMNDAGEEIISNNSKFDHCY